MTAFIKFIYESLAKNSATTFISKDISHRRNIADNLLAIIQARISTSTQDTRNTLFTAKQSLCGTKHITSHNDISCRRKYFRKQSRHNRNLCYRTAGTIEFYFFYRRTRSTKLWQQLVSENAKDYVL